MTLPNKLKLAALASAAMPDLAVVRVRESEQRNATDEASGINQAVIQDTTGNSYDVFAAAGEAGRRRLSSRAKAARTLATSPELAGFGFGVDRALVFKDAGGHSATGEYAVLITPHIQGEARPLDLLTLEDCASLGTAIGAIHRQRSGSLPKAQYPGYSTGQIRAQLTGWIKRLQHAGHVPPAITSSWATIIDTDGLWSFATCLVHGGFADGDIIFSGSAITTVTNWQNMQINDPARDLAWIFAKLDESHRDALMSAYGRIMGSRLDALILLRANLWLQMEEVGGFIDALNQADSSRITKFKAQVERLAHQLTVATNRSASAESSSMAAIRDREHGLSGQAEDPTASSATPESQADETAESDKTDSSPVSTQDEDDRTADRAAQPVHSGQSLWEQQYATGSRNTTAAVEKPSEDAPQTPHGQTTPSSPYVMPKPSSSETIVLPDISDQTASQDGPHPAGQDAEDKSNKGEQPTVRSDAAPTVAIPLLEREERALRDSNAEIAGHDRHRAAAKDLHLTGGEGEPDEHADGPDNPAASDRQGTAEAEGRNDRNPDTSGITEA